MVFDLRDDVVNVLGFDAHYDVGSGKAAGIFGIGARSVLMRVMASTG
jgi:hypothetical protein